MVKLMILYKKPDYIPDFETNYTANLALLEKMPGILRRQANMVLGGPGGHSPYYRCLEFYFEDFNALDAALRSDAGVEAGQDLMRYTGNLVELIFVDVFEDATPPQ